MDVREAILALCQSEKIKTGLIWVSQALEMMHGMAAHEQVGTQRIIKGMIQMTFQEVALARNVAGGELWAEVERYLDQAMIMVDSGVGLEAVSHLTQALSQVTTLGHRAMTLLREQGLL